MYFRDWLSIFPKRVPFADDPRLAGSWPGTPTFSRMLDLADFLTGPGASSGTANILIYKVVMKEGQEESLPFFLYSL